MYSERLDNLERKINDLIIYGGQVEQTPNHMEITIDPSSSTSGVTIYWAKVTAVTDANNYTVSIYDRSDEATAIATSKQCRVFDIVDELAVNDWIPVQTSSITGEDYECLQQMGAVG